MREENLSSFRSVLPALRSEAIESIMTEYGKLECLLRITKFDNSDPAHLIGLAFSGRILEITYSMTELLKSESDAAQFPLLRVLMELAVQFSYLTNFRPTSTREIELLDTVERVKSIKQLPQNEIDDKLKATLALLENRKSELDKSGVKSIKMEGMLKKLKSEDWYGIYRILSGATHARLYALARASLTEVDGRHKIKVFSPMPDEDFALLCSTVKRLILSAVTNFSKLGGNIDKEALIVLAQTSSQAGVRE
jgi:hypothetical protein